MQGDNRFFPNAMTTQDLAAMRQAMRLATELLEAGNEEALNKLPAIVFSYYQRGLVDPERLAAIAAFSASSRIFRNQYRAATAQVCNR